MLSTPRYLGTPVVAAAAGCPARYHFWMGNSATRYLFTEVEAEALSHFRGAVVLIAKPEGAGALAVHRLATLETGADLRPLLRDIDRGKKVLVHLLATTPAARQAVVGDLLEEEVWALAA